MIKKYIFIFIILISCFYFMQNAFAMNSNLQSNNQIPEYTASFKIVNHSPIMPTLVIRFYQMFGDSSDTGWQSPVDLPTATLNGNPVPVVNAFSYEKNYLVGSVGLGYDQYAQYLGVVLPASSDEKILTITGTFQQVAYMSAALYSNVDGVEIQEELLDRQMNVVNGESNPYIVTNPSVFSYTTEHINSNLNTFTNIRKVNKLNLKLANDNSGKIEVYRLDKESSERDLADDIAPDGCSRAYLFANKNDSQEMIILRIKIPKTFIENQHPDKVFSQYQTRYFSVGSHRQSYDGIILDYWTVNARMLKDYEDADGYAYVFFAPDTYTKQLATEQGTPPTKPPVMEWGRYKGYLLGDPSYAIILRYRDPDPNWQGSPENAKCYVNSTDLKPVTADELGEYFPEIYGDTLDHFNAGHIGIVNKNASWPENSNKQIS